MPTYATQVQGHKADLWRGKSALLGRLDIELTERCNNNCAHCYINLPATDEAARARELDTRTLQGILIEAAALGCLTVRFTGGEPLLRPDFAELYLFARRLGLKVMIFSNATLLTADLADLFARVPPLERIEVTVYGMSERTYQRVSRVRGAHAAAWRGIKLLVERNIPFVVKGALVRPDEADVAAFEEWAKTLPAMSAQPSYAMFFNLRSRRDSAARNNMIRRLRLTPDEGLRFLARDPARLRTTQREFCQKFLGVPGDKLFSCGSGVGGGCVDAYGMLQPCMLLRHPAAVYDLQRGSLKDALTRFFPALRETRATNPDYLARCAHCFIKSLCDQCPAQSWMEHGTLDTPVQYFCDVAHAQARWLGLVGESESAWQVTDWKERVARM